MKRHGSSVINEMEDETCDAGDTCTQCGYADFFYDACTWEATCTNCGVVTSFEVGCEETYHKPKTYYKHNYFTNKILSDAMNAGFKIDRFEMVEYERLYRKCVRKFYDTQSIHKRKYMINANFTLWMIARFNGKNVKPYIKMPKKGTLKRLEKDWFCICPW